MYSLELEKRVYEKFKKLAKKDKEALAAVDAKVKQILANPQRFKPLKFPMAGIYRVHVMGSFVLIYRIDENRKIVILLDYGHHDEIYGH
jgi:YafQ family addiction module toxin component